MRFKTDENLPPEAAAFLRDNGHDAQTVWDQRMQASPTSVWQRYVSLSAGLL